jgi:hypothetical protein
MTLFGVSVKETTVNPRQQKGLELATGYRIKESPKGFLVPSQSGQGTYLVNLTESAATCQWEG